MRSPACGAVFFLLLAACKHQGEPDGDMPVSPSDGAVLDGAVLDGSGLDGSGVDGGGPDMADACKLVIPGTSFCAADLAKATFRFGMCSCTDIDISQSGINVSATSSTTMMSIPAGSIGANGKIRWSSGTVDGNMWASGEGVTTQPVITADNSNVNRDVKCGGDLSVANTYALRIHGDAYVTGATNNAGTMTIDGALHQPASSPAPVGVTPGGGTIIGPVTVDEPCDCSSPIAITPIVAAFQTTNSDAAAGLTPTSFIDFGTKNITLGCGAYYFDAITNGSLTITATGNTAIFVAGDVDAKLNIHPDPGAQLDVFVAGNLHLTTGFVIGATEAPANTRLYVGGSAVNLDGAFSLRGNLYAPNADLTIDTSAFDVHGAFFAHKITMSTIAGSLVYDPAILDLPGCLPPGGGCTTCNDCNGATPACKGGTCTACTTDSDCCPPLTCATDGTCVPVVL